MADKILRKEVWDFFFSFFKNNFLETDAFTRVYMGNLEKKIQNTTLEWR